MLKLKADYEWKILSMGNFSLFVSENEKKISCQVVSDFFFEMSWNLQILNYAAMVTQIALVGPLMSHMSTARDSSQTLKIACFRINH